jgi:hypothetical protein
VAQAQRCATRLPEWRARGASAYAPDPQVRHGDWRSTALALAERKELRGMAKVKKAGAPEERTWASTPGTYIAGQANIDGADKVAIEMERKWGCDRLRLLVDTELCEKFDRQRYLFNQAVWYGDLEAVRRESGRMISAWRTLDRVAESAGALKLAPVVWEVPMEGGFVAAIVQDAGDMKDVVSQGRKIVVYTLEEIGRLLDAHVGIAKVKQAFPGTEVSVVRKSISDPLLAIRDSKVKLDDPIDDVGVYGGMNAG